MDRTKTGLTGEFYVLAQLIQRGFVATFTLGNTKGVDILVSNPDLNKLFKVEVKTSDRPPGHESLFSSERCYGWPMNSKHEHISEANLFYCFVALQGYNKLPLFFVVPSAYVALYVREEHEYWLRMRKNKVAETTIRRFRIPISDPMDFGNNWDILMGGNIPESQLTLHDPWYPRSTAT